MKLLIHIIFFLAACNCIAQTSITIKGTVTNTDYKEPVQNAVIYLSLSEGDTLARKTDSTGRYEFRFNTNTPSSCTITLSVTNDTKSASVRNGCFFNSKDIGKIAQLEADREYVKDFGLTRALHCGETHFSPFVFYTNSTISCNDSLHKTHSPGYDDFETLVKALLNMLKENSTMIVELQGHASSIDKKPEQIALRRAEAIKETLVARGVDGKRIQTKGWGNLKVLMTDNMIQKAPTEKNRIFLHLRSQRVTFRIVSWDYVKKGEEEAPDIEGK